MITLGVDTHKHRHRAVALDALGQLLGELSFTATAAGYVELQRWAEGLNEQQHRLVFGIEGAGSGGAGLCEHLQRAGHTVVEVERPRRKERRASQFDRIDALAAAKCALVSDKGRRRGAAGFCQRFELCWSPAAPASRNARACSTSFRRRTRRRLWRCASASAMAPASSSSGASCQCARGLAATSKNAQCSVSCATSRHAPARWQSKPNATSTISQSSSARSTVPCSTSPALDRSRPPSCLPPTRPASSTKQRSPAATRTAPLPASSGKTVRHRLNRGGDRQVNNAIHTIALIRAKHQPETRAYLDRRMREGKTNREAMRALKRHISRDLFNRLAEAPLTS
jgi:transposase